MEFKSMYEELENPTFAPIAGLWDWSRNYDFAESPWALFLDVIGYSFDAVGTRIFEGHSLDFISADEFADALKIWATRPNDVVDYIQHIETWED